MDAFLSDAGIQLLRDEGVLLNDSFYLYGRADAQRPGAGISERKSPQEITQDMDKTRPIIVIDHQPRELAALAAAGVDIDLCGHTHDGQMFPGNLIVRPFWENFLRLSAKRRMHNIVTSVSGCLSEDACGHEGGDLFDYGAFQRQCERAGDNRLTADGRRGHKKKCARGDFLQSNCGQEQELRIKIKWRQRGTYTHG